MDKLYIIILAGVALTLFIIAFIVLTRYSKKISNIEKTLLRQYTSRSDSLPALYEITKDTILRHQNVFNEAMKLRKKEFVMLSNEANFIQMMQIESKVTHEIKFIFDVCSKHPKMLKERNFIYLYNIFQEKSKKLNNLKQSYFKELETYNKYVKIKNATIIGYLIPMPHRVTF